MFSHEDIANYREAFDLNVVELNNIQPPNIISQIDAYINSKIQLLTTGSENAFSIKWLIDTVVEMDSDKESFSTPHYIAMIFKLLNMFGFNPDKKNKKAFIAGFHDSSHTSNASVCDYFVTSDKRCRIKALAAYEYINSVTDNNINTQVVEPEVMMEILEDLQT